MSYRSITSKPCQVDDQHSPQNKTQAALLQGLPFRGAPVKKDTLYHPTKIPPSLTALVIVSLSDNTGPHLFLFLLELPALVCSSTPFIMLCQGSDPSIYSIFTCAVKVVLLVTRMPTFVTEYCSFSRPLTLFIPCSISLLLPSFTASA